ncbi:MAG TPA: AraC family transcriptional regulator, partial [Clostridia bacterium]|nr:AraC family transcriptional regulator [Clostridia bacterium]
YWAEGSADAELAALLRIQTPAGQEAALRRLVHTASLAATQSQEAQGVETLRALQDFIAKHAFDPLFNMDKVVEAFGQPPSTLSRLFKRHFGMNFIDYVSYLRMQKARELLTATDLKLKDIVQAIGYSDVANFIRKFRIQEGMTPGDYRKAHRQTPSA